MSLMSNRYLILLRHGLRACGVPKLIAHFGGGFERAFSEHLLGACQEGDVVWDVGANIGHYSRLFADRVGERGAVFAFEPSRVNVTRLSQNCEDRPNVHVLAFGLSDKSERVNFVEGDDPDNTTFRVATSGDPSGQVTKVELYAGDAVIASGTAQAPNLVKIDVEGHELSVLTGLTSTLRNPQLRNVFVEVHFGVLDGSGRGDHPKRIEDLLKQSGFRLKWTDPSHIHATRP